MNRRSRPLSLPGSDWFRKIGGLSDQTSRRMSGWTQEPLAYKIADNQPADLYCSLPVEVSLIWSSWLKLELVSEKVGYVSVGEDSNSELSEGTCQDGNVASGLGTVFAGSVFVVDFGFFPSLTYTITILYDSWQLLHRPT